MKKTTLIILAIVLLQSCRVYHSMTEKNKSITNYYCHDFDICTKYSSNSEFSSEILYLTNDSTYYFESQGEGRGPLFSFGQYEVKDSILTLEQDEEKTREYIVDYNSDKAPQVEYTPFITLDFLTNSSHGEEIKKEIPVFYRLDNYDWKIKDNKNLEKKLRGEYSSVIFRLEQSNSLFVVNDTLLSPGIHLINGEKYEVKIP